MARDATVQIHNHVFASSAAAPAKLCLVTEASVNTGGHVWRGTHAPSADVSVEMLALTTTDSWAEVSWDSPSTAVGIQFAGNQDDGWARILVDGEAAWQGNTYGENGHFNHYVEIAGLEEKTHTVRVEVVGRTGVEGGNIHVSLTAFGLGEVSEENKAASSSKVYTPIVFGSGDSPRQ